MSTPFFDLRKKSPISRGRETDAHTPHARLIAVLGGAGEGVSGPREMRHPLG